MRVLFSASLLTGLLFSVIATQAQTAIPTQLTGSTWELNTFDGKLLPTGRLVSHVTSLSATPAATQATVHHQAYDLSDRLVLEYDLPAQVAANGPVQLDLRAFINPHLLRALQLTDLRVENNTLASLPAAAARVGDLLPEAQVALVDVAGPTPRGVEISSTGRWLDGSEKITTPAGTFTCLRLNQHLRIEAYVAGAQKRYDTRVTSWYAPEMGVVRSETYVNGALFDLTVLHRVLPGSPATTSVTTAGR